MGRPVRRKAARLHSAHSDRSEGQAAGDRLGHRALRPGPAAQFGIRVVPPAVPGAARREAAGGVSTRFNAGQGDGLDRYRR